MHSLYTQNAINSTGPCISRAQRSKVQYTVKQQLFSTHKDIWLQISCATILMFNSKVWKLTVQIQDDLHRQ